MMTLLISVRAFTVRMANFEGNSVHFEGRWMDSKFIGFVINLLIGANMLAVAVRMLAVAVRMLAVAVCIFSIALRMLNMAMNALAVNSMTPSKNGDGTLSRSVQNLAMFAALAAEDNRTLFVAMGATVIAARTFAVARVKIFVMERRTLSVAV